MRFLWADAGCQYLAPRAREQPSRPFLGTPRQTSARADPSRAPPMCADHTSPALCRRPDGKGEVIFGREWGLILMQIFKVDPYVSANPPPSTPPRAALRPRHTAQTLFCAARQRLSGRVASAQVVV